MTVFPLLHINFIYCAILHIQMNLAADRFVLYRAHGPAHSVTAHTVKTQVDGLLA